MGGKKMDVIYKICCGIDVHKNKLVACLKEKGKKDVIKEFGGQTKDIKDMADWLKEEKCEKIGAEFYNKFNKDKKANAYMKKIKELGYDVQLVAQVG